VLGLSRRSAQREGGPGFWWLKACLVLCSVALILPVIGALNLSGSQMGTRNVWTAMIFAGSMLFPAAAIVSFLATIDALMSAAGKWLRAYALVISVAALLVSGYLAAWGMIAFRPWSF
jgi:hypothetical protein